MFRNVSTAIRTHIAVRVFDNTSFIYGEQLTAVTAFEEKHYDHLTFEMIIAKISIKDKGTYRQSIGYEEVIIMPRKQSDQIIETVRKDDCTIYKFADGTEYTVRAFVRDVSIPENADGKTYSERIAPQAIPFDEALKRCGLTREEWWRQREEAALSNFYHCPMRTTIVT